MDGDWLLWSGSGIGGLDGPVPLVEALPVSAPTASVHGQTEGVTTVSLVALTNARISIHPYYQTSYRQTLSQHHQLYYKPP